MRQTFRSRCLVLNAAAPATWAGPHIGRSLPLGPERLRSRSQEPGESAPGDQGNQLWRNQGDSSNKAAAPALARVAAH